MSCMKKLDNKGFSKFELMTMLGLLAILFAVGSNLAVGTGVNYKGFKNLAQSFFSSVSMYRDRYPKGNNKYYLYELIEKGYSNQLKNPANASEECDIYSSYVEEPPEKPRRVNLVCGNFILVGELNGQYKVYEVTEWSDVPDASYNDNGVLYNYKKEGKLMLNEYVGEENFLNLFFVNEKKIISSPSEIKSSGEYELSLKAVYRQKTLVKELK